MSCIALVMVIAASMGAVAKRDRPGVYQTAAWLVVADVAIVSAYLLLKPAATTPAP